MRSALPRLGGRSATVLGSLAVVVPLVSGVPAAGVAADPASGVGGVATVAAALPPSGVATLVRPVAARPVTPEVAEVPVPEADRPGAPHLAAVSEPQPVDGFGVVGATWRGNEPRALDLQVRTKDGGTWSGWEELPVHAEHAPDPGTAEARAATRTGSDPVVVGDVDRVQVRATSASGEAPRDLELSVVDPGTSPADDDPAAVATTVGAPAAGAAAGDATGARPALFTGTTALASQVAVRNPPGVRAPRQRIRSRRAWGANERLSPGSPSYGTVRRGFVHHTVNANDYTRGEVPAIIRGIHSYHTQSLGWRDVGYNFLVDRFGRIWEGRKGGVTRAVIGAHTSGYNHVAFAMSAIGNFETARPRSPMVRAYGRLMGWKLGLHRVRASARTIDGHRDVGQTACPGRHLYRKVKDGSIHRRARRWQVGGTAPAPKPKPEPKPEPEPEPQPQPKPAPEPTEPPRPDEPGLLRDLQADGFPDLLAREAGTQRLKVLAGDGGPGFTSRQVAVKRVGASALVTGVGDVTRDGRPDLLIRHPRTKVAKVRPGRRNGGFGRAIAATRRFAEADLLAGVGDMVSNRRPDLVMREARSGRVWLVPGQRNGKWGRKRLVIRRGGGLTLLGGGGDLDGDGRRDLVARDGRRLLLYPGRRKGRVGAPRVIGRGWRGKDLAAAGYDVTGDGRDDLVARDRRSRRTWIYVTRDDGSIAGRFGGWRGWRDLNRLTGAGDVTRDGNADLVGRTSDGQLVVLPSRGTRWLQGPVDTGRWARKANFAQVVGDWNDDGYADVVSRANGTIWLYRGKGGGTLGRHVVLRRKWGNRTFLATPGDMDGDGLPDLVSRTPDGRIWVHTSNGRRGVKSRYVAREGMFKADLVTAAGFWDDDPYRDLVVRRARSKELFLVPGTKDGEFGRPVPLDRGQSYADYDQIVGVGHFNRDRYPDIVARERRTGRMWLFAGSGKGLLRAREFVGSGMDRYDLFG